MITFLGVQLVCTATAMQQADKEKLLRAAARFDSDSDSSAAASDTSSSRSQEGGRARGSRRHKKKEHKHSSSKKRKSKHSSSKQKSHKRHKRSDHEKIAELERRAAAMGAAASMLPGSRLGFGRHTSGATTAAAAASGDAAVLDTSGDANNALYESLYGGDVPRYNRMDPLDLVRVSRRLGAQLAADTNTGNATADR